MPVKITVSNPKWTILDTKCCWSAQQLRDLHSGSCANRAHHEDYRRKLGWASLIFSRSPKMTIFWPFLEKTENSRIQMYGTRRYIKILRVVPTGWGKRKNTSKIYSSIFKNSQLLFLRISKLRVEKNVNNVNNVNNVKKRKKSGANLLDPHLFLVTLVAWLEFVGIGPNGDVDRSSVWQSRTPLAVQLLKITRPGLVK